MKAMNRSNMGTLAFSLVLILSGCARGTKDPLDKYPNVKKDIPPTFEVAKDQNYKYGCGITPVSKPMIVSSVEGGDPTTQEVYLRGPHLTPNDDIIVNDAPAGFKMEKIKLNGNEILFHLTYAPPKGTIGGTAFNKRFTIELVPSSQVKDIYKCPLSLVLEATRSLDIPTIIQIGAASNNQSMPKIDVSKNNDYSFKVLVEGPSLDDPSQLKLVYSFDETSTATELPVFPLAPAVLAANAPKRLEDKGGKSVYEFQVTIKMDFVKTLFNAYQDKNKSFFNQEINKSISPEANIQFTVINTSTTPPIASGSEARAFYIQDNDSALGRATK